MADFLFGDLGLIPVPKRKERQFRLRDDFSLTDFTDSELRSRYRFRLQNSRIFCERERRTIFERKAGASETTARENGERR